jgi:hypothetical protein
VFSTEATAWFSVGPETGQPASVIQMDLFWATASTLLRAVVKREAPLSMELSRVFSK